MPRTYQAAQSRRRPRCLELGDLQDRRLATAATAAKYRLTATSLQESLLVHLGGPQ